jgi:hypothetical protein
MTTEIGRLNLRLPSGFEGRAERIGRLVGEALAGCELPAGRIAHLKVGPVTVNPRGSDRAVAEGIAQSIRAAIGSPVSGHTHPLDQGTHLP